MHGKSKTIEINSSVYQCKLMKTRNSPVISDLNAPIKIIRHISFLNALISSTEALSIAGIVSNFIDKFQKGACPTLPSITFQVRPALWIVKCIQEYCVQGLICSNVSRNLFECILLSKYNFGLSPAYILPNRQAVGVGGALLCCLYLQSYETMLLQTHSSQGNKGPIPYIYGTKVGLSLCLQMS